MTDPVPGWPISVARPTIVLRASCHPDEALHALAHALRSVGFRLRPSTVPMHLEATRRSWWYLAGLDWPAKSVVIADGAPTADGCELRVEHPTGNEDITARDRAVRTLRRTVAALRASGVHVVVGEWESGLPKRR